MAPPNASNEPGFSKERGSIRHVSPQLPQGRGRVIVEFPPSLSFEDKSAVVAYLEKLVKEIGHQAVSDAARAGFNDTGYKDETK